MLERLVAVSDVIEEMDLVFARKECRSNTVDRCISPSFVIETTFPIEEVEECGIRFASPQVQVSNLEIAPEMTSVVCIAAIVR